MRNVTSTTVDVREWVNTYSQLVAGAIGVDDTDAVRTILTECATWEGHPGPGRVSGQHRAAEAARRLAELSQLDTAGLLARWGYNRLAEPDD